VVSWVIRELYKQEVPYPSAEQILGAVRKLLRLPAATTINT
jgi:hypothetical protein